MTARRAVPRSGRAMAFASAVSVAALLLMVHPAHACRYSVREVGFIDLDTAPYRFYVLVDQQTPQAIVDAVRRMAFTRLRGGNVEAEVVPVHEQPGHRAFEYVKDRAALTYPAGLLVSPDGRARVQPLPEEEEALGDLLDGLLDSPLRARITDSAIEAYCVVLLIDGDDDAANAEGRRRVEEAIAEMTAGLGNVEKPTKQPPVFIELKKSDRVSEAVLLWSLGEDWAAPKQPGVAVLFGRCRRLGEVMRADRVETGELVRVMALVGASCECGLDRSYMQGIMLPIRWDASTREKLTRHLGFDAESPMVKMEVGQILSQGAAGGGYRPDDPFFGYREVGLGGDAPDTGPVDEADDFVVEDVVPAPPAAKPEIEESAATAPAPVPAAKEVPVAEEKPGAGTGLLTVLAAIAAFNIALALGLVIRARRKGQD